MMKNKAGCASRLIRRLRVLWKRRPQQPQPVAPESLRFVVLFKPGPKWVTGKTVFEQPLKGHVEYLQGLYDQGKLLYAGPLGNAYGGLAVLALANEAEANQILAEEPAIRQGIFLAESHPWLLTFDVTQARSWVSGTKVSK